MNTTSQIVGFYARVSSVQQAQANTIDSQIIALEERIKADGFLINPEHRFIDDGFSGSTVIRPALERLRDVVAQGGLDTLYVLSPDRFSRKYAYQVLLIEEFAGVIIKFILNPPGATAEENLLQQVQGIIAEYERAKIIERNRRGKLHSAKQGSVNVLSGAPYGYRYITKQYDGQAHYKINFEQAFVVKNIFSWIGVERLSIGEVVKRLHGQAIKTKTGKECWDRSTIWGMLQNPAYKGKAAFGKTKAGTKIKPVRPQKRSSEYPKKQYSVTRTKPEEWIDIPVPALVSEEIFDAVQEQLEENRKLARQRKRGARYLLQGLTVCGHCQYAYYGKPVSSTNAKKGKPYVYYRCIGTDAYRFGGEKICDNRQIRLEVLEEAVWDQVIQVLKDPERIKREYNRRLDEYEKESCEVGNTKALDKQREKLKKVKSRLIDVYAEGIIDGEEFKEKIAHIKVRLSTLDKQIEDAQTIENKQYELFLIINHLEEFSQQISHNIEDASFDEKRSIIRAVVKRVEIHRDEVVVIFRVKPTTTPSQDGFIENERLTTTNREVSFMQDCTRSYNSTLRSSNSRLLPMTMFIHYTYFYPLLYKPNNALVPYSVFDEFNEPVMFHSIEELTDIQI